MSLKERLEAALEKYPKLQMAYLEGQAYGRRKKEERNKTVDSEQKESIDTEGDKDN